MKLEVTDVIIGVTIHMTVISSSQTAINTVVS